MSILHDFTDALSKELRKLADSHTRELIKGEASRHERLCGRILAYQEIESLIVNTVKRWSTADAHEDNDA